MSVGTKRPNTVLKQELTPVLSTQYALSWHQASIVTFFAFSFLLISHLPISLNTVWSHANQGRWILDHSTIPSELPNAVYADGMPYLATSWLSDTATAFGIQAFGFEFVPAVTAILTTFTMGLWCWLCYRAATQKRLVLLAAAVMLLTWAFGLSALRSQVYAGVLLPVLCWVVWPLSDEDRTTDGRTWLGACGLLALWSNLDASFFLGVAVLGCLAVDSAASAIVAAAKRGTGFWGFVGDARFQRSLLLAEAGAAATLASPRGWQTWTSVLQVNGRGPLWSVAGGDYGLRLASVSGLVFASLIALVVLVWQCSKQSIAVRDVCLFLIVMIATALNPMNLYWLAPVALFLVARHWQSVIRPWNMKKPTRDEVDHEYHPLLFAWTLASGLVIWCAFAFSPISAPLLSAKTRSPDRILDRAIPVDVGDWLRTNSQGVIWAPSDWSDWFLWSSGDQDLFVNSRLSLFPAAIQRDYGRVFTADEEWDNITKQYNIGTLVIDKQRQSKLAKEAIRSGRWQLARETDRSMVLLLRDG